MNTYIGLDLGTSMLKAVAIDDSGKTLAKAAKEIPLISHSTGWAEQ
jgi:sugar (pentulose or hexulose) kinase